MQPKYSLRLRNTSMSACSRRPRALSPSIGLRFFSVYLGPRRRQAPRVPRPPPNGMRQYSYGQYSYGLYSCGPMPT